MSGVVISNGFNKFHLAAAAAEAGDHGTLAALVTGAYPTPATKRVLGFSGAAKVARLAAREEAIAPELVRPLWLSEGVYQIGDVFRRFPSANRLCDAVDAFSLSVYGAQAVRVIRGAEHARVYHFRSGFGGRSVRESQRRGMIALCDHSIAHPAVIEQLVERGGKLFATRPAKPQSRVWTRVFADLEAADAVVVNSEFVKRTFVHAGWDEARVRVVYSGVPDSFLQLVQPRAPRRDAPLRLLFAGALERRKGAEALLSAVRRLTDVAFTLRIAGSVDKRMLRRFEDVASRPELRFLGTLSAPDLAREMSEADAFVFPSLAEGSARVVFEALAAGCYVITTPNAGSIVQDGVHGRIVEPGETDLLAAAIREVAGRATDLTEIGERNAALVREQYTQSAYGAQLNELYRELSETAL